jgi:fatty-acyl-CoA synthase
MSPPLSAVKSHLASAKDRVLSSARFAARSGMVWEFGARGVFELARTFAAGVQNPASAYRIGAANHPDRTALVFGSRSYSYRELDNLIDRAAHAFHDAGVRKGMSVLLAMRNCPEFVICSAALGRLKGSAVAISWRSTARELTYLANHSKARMIVCDAEVYRTVLSARPDLDRDLATHAVMVSTLPDARAQEGAAAVQTFEQFLSKDRRRFPEGVGAEDAAVVIYTSGTTGKPKGAVRRFPRSAATAAFKFLAETPLRVEDVHLVACPMYHSTAYAFLTFSHILGNTVVLLDEFSPESFFAHVERHDVSTTALVPTMIHRLMEAKERVRGRYRTRSLRVVFSGGAHLPPTLARDFMDTYGDVLYNFYGATETGLVTLATPGDLRAAPGTIGRALPGNEIRLLDAAHRPVAMGEVGELFVKNELLVAGYHDDVAATKGSMAEGCFSVGDLARQDAAGRYFLEGRRRDMIVSGGINVYPAEVEHVLLEHPEVSDVAVVGQADAEWGERVVAFVVASRQGDQSVTEPELVAFAKERLSSAKRPKAYHFVAELPRNPTGKVLKRELEDRLRAGLVR